MTSHTPGPWTILNSFGTIRVLAKQGPIPVQVAQAYGVSDAALIGAAPDYDEAARCFVRWAERFDDVLPESIRNAMESAFGGKLRAAIAKAETTS